MTDNPVNAAFEKLWVHWDMTKREELLIAEDFESFKLHCKHFFIEGYRTATTAIFKNVKDVFKIVP